MDIHPDIHPYIIVEVCELAPPKKYRNRQDIHVNIEAELKQFGDYFNINPSIALEEGYIYTINQDIARYGASDDIRNKWFKFNESRNKEKIDALNREVELKKKSEESGLQKRILDDDKNRFANWLYSEFYPAFSSDEIRHYAKLVLDNNDNKVRFALESLKKQYTIRSNNTITPWTSEETAQAINHLIELGGI